MSRVLNKTLLRSSARSSAMNSVYFSDRECWEAKVDSCAAMLNVPFRKGSLTQILIHL